MSRTRTGRAARADPELRRQHTRDAIGLRLARPPATSYLEYFSGRLGDGPATA